MVWVLIFFYSLFSLLSFHFILFSSLSSLFSLTGSLSLTSVPLTDASQSLSPSEAVAVADLSHSSTRLTTINIFNHHRSRSATLDLADLTPRPPSILPSSFSSLYIHLSLCLSLVMGLFFFFFLAAIWVDMILVSNCSGWFAVEVLLRQWILVAGGCVVDVVAVFWW